jgi:predicted transcriptional regulator
MAELTTLQERRLNAGHQVKNSHLKDRVEAEQDLDEAAPKIRVSLDISPELYAKLQALAKDIRGTKSDVLRKSLALMDVAVQARKSGKKIGIADRTEQLTTEIIGFEY